MMAISVWGEFGLCRRAFFEICRSQQRWLRGGRPPTVAVTKRSATREDPPMGFGDVKAPDSAEISAAKRLRRQQDAVEAFLASPNPHRQPSKNVSELIDAAEGYADAQAWAVDDPWASPPYAKQDKIFKAQKAQEQDPRHHSVILFPGQGTHAVGMASELLKFPNVKEMFDCASEILGYDLERVCTRGPGLLLNQTVHSQPAIFVSSLAAVERLREEESFAIENCTATAGYSLGEFTALVFARALRFEDAVRLVKARAEAMQRASDLTPSAMATIFLRPSSRLADALAESRDYAAANGVARQLAICQVASDLFTQCKVIGGHELAMRFLQENASRFHLAGFRRLPVSGAFHTPLMEPALESFAPLLKSTAVKRPQISVYSNFDAEIYKSEDDIKKKLIKQMTKPVKWEQSMHAIYDRDDKKRFPFTFECGPGAQLGQILRKTNLKAANSYRSIPA